MTWTIMMLLTGTNDLWLAALVPGIRVAALTVTASVGTTEASPHIKPGFAVPDCEIVRSLWQSFADLLCKGLRVAKLPSRGNEWEPCFSPKGQAESRGTKPVDKGTGPHPHPF
eukprot:3934422-Rhodomonas_salina.4